MNSKNNSVKTQKNKTRKEWRRNKRRAAFLRKKEAKTAIENKRAEEPKRYDLLAQYNKGLANSVQEIIAKNKIKYAIMTDSYFVISNLSEGACKEIEDAFKDCTQNNGTARRPSIVKFSKRKSKTIITTDKTSKVPTNNTLEAKRSAKLRRKQVKADNHKKGMKRDDSSKKSTKENPIPARGRNVKKLKYRAFKHNGKVIYKVIRSNESSTQRKIHQRANKAVKYIIKKAKEVSRPKKTLKYVKKKAVQQTFNFAA